MDRLFGFENILSFVSCEVFNEVFNMVKGYDGVFVFMK